MKGSIVKSPRAFRRVHNTIGLVFGVQFIFWMLSGLFFTLFPIEQVRGANLRQDISHGSLNLELIEVDAAKAASVLGLTPERAELSMFLGRPVWKLDANEETHLVDAQTGAIASPISQATALEIARGGMKSKAGFAGEPWLLETDPRREYAGPLPVWVVDYDPGSVRIYIDAQTGTLRTVRTNLWRTFDVFWRFHIMDVTGADRVDSWWMKLVSFLGLTLALSGMVLGIDGVRRGTLWR